MKKLLALVLALVCVVGIVGCGQQEQNNNPNNISDNNNSIEWVDGIAFVELAPADEAKSSEEITLTGEKSEFAYSITYARPGLTLAFGLIAADGTEYVKEIAGGSDVGYIENIPAGTYRLIVRNSGDYTNFPSYQDGTENYNATGAINYSVE